MANHIHFVSVLERATSMGDLSETARTFSREMGFQHFLYAVRIPKPPGPAVHFVVSGYPASWRTIYDVREYVRIDPIVQHTFGSAMPIVWDEVPRDDKTTQQFFAEAAEHGLGHGVSAPVYSRRGEVGLFSLSRGEEIAAELEYRIRLKQDLQWFATAFNEAALRIPVVDQRVPIGQQRLTARERECLTWAAEGKRSAEIAEIMAITERTVLAHIETAGQKLGVSGRHNIVARAVSLGELELNREALLVSRTLPPTQEFPAR